MKKQNPYRRAMFAQNRALFVIALVISALPGISSVVLSRLQAWALDAVAAGSGHELALAGVSFASAIFGFFLLTAGAFRVKTRFLQRAVKGYKDYAFARLTQKNIESFSAERTSGYLSALTNDIPAIENQYLHNLFIIAMEAVLFCAALAAVLRSGWKNAVLMLLLCTLPTVLSMSQAKGVARAERALSDENGRFTGTLQDMLHGFSVIKSFRAERAASEQFQKANAKVEFRRFRWRWADCKVMLLSYELCSPAVTFAVFFTCCLRALRGEISVGTVLYLASLMNCFMAPIQTVPQLWAQHQAAGGLIDKMAELLEEEEGTNSAVSVSELSGEITLEHVTFGYAENMPILHDISLRLEAGKSYAVVGASGSGKTTLLKLLMGICTGYDGSIQIDGEELRNIDRGSLYDLMSLIQQEVFLFDDTLKNNLTMFGPFSDEILNDAVAKAGLLPLIDERGYDSPCGENGKNLSGGERQRISIARSLLRGTPVLLLDEVTAALDVKTAYDVAQAILHMEGLLRIVVTHRMEAALLRQYDEIIVLKDGAVREQGSFEELIEKNGYFYSLYTISAS